MSNCRADRNERRHYESQVWNCVVLTINMRWRWTDIRRHLNAHHSGNSASATAVKLSVDKAVDRKRRSSGRLTEYVIRCYVARGFVEERGNSTHDMNACMPPPCAVFWWLHSPMVRELRLLPVAPRSTSDRCYRRHGNGWFFNRVRRRVYSSSDAIDAEINESYALVHCFKRTQLLTY